MLLVAYLISICEFFIFFFFKFQIPNMCHTLLRRYLIYVQASWGLFCELCYGQVLLRDPLDENVTPVVEVLQRRLIQVNAVKEGQEEEKEQLMSQNDIETSKPKGTLHATILLWSFLIPNLDILCDVTMSISNWIFP